MTAPAGPLDGELSDAQLRRIAVLLGLGHADADADADTESEALGQAA